jgi:hypothetical protein
MEANRRLLHRDIRQVSCFGNEPAMKEYDHYGIVRLAAGGITEMQENLEKSSRPAPPASIGGSGPALRL